jgi:glycogen operon protein
MYLDGRGIRHRDERGRPVVDESYLIWLHAGPDPVEVVLPGPPWGDGYELVVATEYPTGAPPRPTAVAPGPVEMPGRSVWAMRVLRTRVASRGVTASAEAPQSGAEPVATAATATGGLGWPAS